MKGNEVLPIFLGKFNAWSVLKCHSNASETEQARRGMGHNSSLTIRASFFLMLVNVGVDSSAAEFAF